VPVCFPQFGGFGPLSQHGFARNSEFVVVSSEPDRVTLSFSPNQEHLKSFPHPFDLRVEVSKQQGNGIYPTRATIPWTFLVFLWEL
jgi:glucose-6-phosphate 1-epimerase